jgi:hypothetical protein
MCSNCALDLFGGWTLDKFELEEWERAPEFSDPPKNEGGDRFVPTVAIPLNATLALIDELRFWSKNYTESNKTWFATQKGKDGQPTMVEGKREAYWVMQFSVKPHYYHHFDKHLKSVGGFLLVKKQ